VLLVSHDASRTGAPAVATSFARWAARTGAAQIHVALLGGGPLTSTLRALGPTTVASRAEVELARAAGPRAHAPRLRRAARSFDRPPIVVANTLAAWPAAATVERRDALVCWVHELDRLADVLVAPDQRSALIAATDRFLAAGPAVARMLVERWGIAPARVATVPPLVEPPAPGAPRSERRVLGAGALVPRKGADLFVSVLASLDPPLTAEGAAWVGGPDDGAYATQVRSDLRRAGLDGRVHLVGPVPTLEPWWPADGVLLHPAREDPAPLVVAEAALRAVPVATWTTGGAADLLRDAGCAHLVAPAGDVVGLAERLARLLADADERRAVGRALADAAAPQLVDRAAPRTLAAIRGDR